MATNPEHELLARLAGIQEILKGVHAAGIRMSSAVKGEEREGFIQNYIAQMLPPTYRVGQGDIIDTQGARSGQVDVVVELPFFPSPPTVGSPTKDRLYIAEGVAAAMEIKSNADRQWNQAVSKAEKVRTLKRDFTGTSSVGDAPFEQIPFFVVAYIGKASMTTYAERIASAPIDGLLVLNPGVFVSSDICYGIRHQGPGALWALVCCLYWRASSLLAAGANLLAYAPSVLAPTRNDAPAAQRSPRVQVEADG